MSQGQSVGSELSGDQLLRSIQSASLTELLAIWRSRGLGEESDSAMFFRCLGERILAQGEPLLAYDVVTAGLQTWPQDVRLQQLQGLALARSGATERANVILENLRSAARTDEETLGMLGRTYKDLASMAATSDERTEYLKRAAEIYGDAYRTSGGYWTGINAATMTLLIGEKSQACQIAHKVREQCLKEIADPSGDSYWELAALGESALICCDWSQAEEWYARAASEGKGRHGDLDSSRRNARLILQYWNHDQAWLDKFLRAPGVIVFAGHMIDRPDRSLPRFPREIENAMAKQIKQKVETLKPGFGFSSAACGADILFLEAMLDYGAEVSVVLPYNEEEFIRDSVEIGDAPQNWRTRFDHVLARAARVITASNQRLGIGGVSYEFCNQLLLGLAAIRCRQLDAKLMPLAVWDGRAGDGRGGAASVVENWRELGHEPEIINPQAFIGDTTGPAGNESPAAFSEQTKVPGEGDRAPLAGFGSRVVALLFADAVGFSKLSEPQIPRFVEHFFGTIAQLTKRFSKSIIASNTWGDGLYFALSDVELAGDFALRLAEMATKTNWTEKGLPAELNLRIALHAGPVYEFDDPITGRRNYGGTHVSQAARIEPITPPGQVYASEAFAALAAAKPNRVFTCDYVGQTPMAKGYGTLPVYHVRPGAAASVEPVR